MNRDYNTSNDKVTNALNNMSKSLKSLAETATVQIELPKINSNDPGKVLTVVGSGEDVRWDKAEPVTELPEVTSSDNSKVLGVVDGEWATTTPFPVITIKKTNSGFEVNGQAYDATRDIPLISDGGFKLFVLNNKGIEVGRVIGRIAGGPPTLSLNVISSSYANNSQVSSLHWVTWDTQTSRQIKWTTSTITLT